MFRENSEGVEGVVELATDMWNSVKFPKDKVHSLATNEHVTVETDKEVKTQ